MGMCPTKPKRDNRYLTQQQRKVSVSRKCLPALVNLCGMMGSVVYAAWELSVSTLAGTGIVMPSGRTGRR
jgi:hypothetical protein